jgi:hypothetical protein
MNIHLGFWIVRGVISVIVLVVLISILVKDDIGSEGRIAGFILVCLAFWGAYSLVALVR